MARDVEGNLFEPLNAYEFPEDESNCCALAIAANDDEMFRVCDGVDYRVVESTDFTSFTECAKTSSIYLGDEPDVKASKSEPVDCPCQDQVTLAWEDTKGWEVAMWLDEQAEAQF